MFFSSIKGINRLIRKYLLKRFYWEKLTIAHVDGETYQKSFSIINKASLNCGRFIRFPY